MSGTCWYKSNGRCYNDSKRIGFEPLYVQMNDLKPGVLHKLNRQFRFYVDWEKAYRRATAGSIILLQHPFHYPQMTREKTLLKMRNKKMYILFQLFMMLRNCEFLEKNNITSVNLNL